jgi:lysozyme
MNILFDDTKIIRDFEGHSLKAYPDPVTKGDPWTISWGLTGAWVKPGLVITQDESKQRFMEYIQKFCDQLTPLIKVPVSKSQYVAVLSLAWNVGIGNISKSTLLKKLNAQDFKGAADEFLKWNKAGGKVIPGLTRRRVAEREFFLTGKIA